MERAVWKLPSRIPVFRAMDTRLGVPPKKDLTKTERRNIHSYTRYMALLNNTAKAAEKWEAQLRKGCLELAILASLWEKRLYGLEILRVLEENSDLVLAEGTVYPILGRLKEEGLLQSEWVEADAGHPRKYYWLTAAGRQRLVSMGRFWDSFAANLNLLLKPVLNGKGRP
jgi:PadR family transcriptional regulator, regulatory protein PadR